MKIGDVQMIKKTLLKNPFQLFIMILLPFVLSISLIILIQSAFLYKYFEKFALNMVDIQQKTDLQNQNHNVTTMAQTARALSTQAYFDDMIKDILYSDVSPVDFSKYMNKLQSYKNIYPFLQSIYIYNGHNIYSRPSVNFVEDVSTFEDKGILNILSDMKNYPSHSIIPRKTPDIVSNYINGSEKYTYVYSYIFYDAQLQSGKINEAIVLNISEEWLSQSINSSENNNTSRVFIIDHAGTLITEDLKYPMLSDLSGTEYIKAIQASKKPIGNLRIKVDGVDSFITYVTADISGWKLISITPYSYIIKDINSMKIKTYIFVICLLIISIITFFFLSRRIYIPVKSIINNYNILEYEKRNEFFRIKQDFLRTLVNNSDRDKIESFSNKFNNYDISLSPSDNFLVILLKIDLFSDFCLKFDFNDRGLMKFGMMNIISELISPAFKNECIDIWEDHLIVLLNYSDSNPVSANETLVAIAKEIQSNIKKHLDVSLSLTFSEVFNNLDSLNTQYLKTLDLSYYRLIFGHSSLIFHETLKPQMKDFNYPQEKDKLLTDALILGHSADAKNIFSDIIHHASQYNLAIFNSTLIRLFTSINNAINVINCNNDLQINFSFNIYLSKLQKIETLDEIESTFFELFENLSSGMQSKKDNKYTEIIEKVINIISKEYPNHNLSLESISEIVNLSPSYLGRLFKKNKLVSITDYINYVRLEKAKEMIFSSEEPINTIMSMSGFLSRSHFFTLFKKAYGVTPNQYRSNTRTIDYKNDL